MVSLSRDAKRMVALIIMQCLLIIFVSMLYFQMAEFLQFAYGVLLGCALNCVKVYMLERAVQRVAQMTEGGHAYGWWQFILRFVLTGGVLVFAALSPHVNLWGTVAGVLTFQTSLYMLRVSIARENARQERGE